LHCTSETVRKDVVALEADDGSVHLRAKLLETTGSQVAEQPKDPRAEGEGTDF
jgi:hypothetical protein